MTSGERKKYIMKLAVNDGMVSIPEVAAHYGVSVETIRRDVNSLCAEKKLRKVHGGAVPSDGGKKSDGGIDYTIGSYAATLVENGDVVMFDSGEAAQSVASEITGVRGVTLITNSVPVASELMKRHRAGEFSGRIIMIGGELDPKYAFSRSPDTLGQLGRLRADKAFITASGVTGDGVSSDGTYESSFSAAMMEHSKMSVLVCESEKFGRDSLARFASASDFKVIVTDSASPVPDEIRAEVVKKGGNIKVVKAK